jgi:beta-glucosidase
MEKFKPDFLLGAATAAHQVEGNNTNSDCWALEQMEHTNYAEPSLDAVDHYNRYEEDIKLLAGAGLNAYRFSIEWARIEPQEGRFDDGEIEHYRRVIQCCRENGVEPIVTMHHFSSPKWLITAGGWEAESTVKYFARYCRYVAERLGDGMKYICTINEANMGLQIAAIAKRYKRQMMSKAAQASAADKAKKAEGTIQLGMNMESLMAEQKAAALESARIFGVDDPRKVQVFAAQRTPEGDMIVMRAHQAAKQAMKEVCPHLKVGLTLSLHDIQAQPGGEEAAAKEWNDEFAHYLPYIKDDDFLGVQNYTRSLIGPDGIQPAPEGAELTQMNYEFYPEALANVIRKVAKQFRGNIIVTENGIGTSDDTRRVEFIRRALTGVQSCIEEGIPVKGYMYWSLLDNFEWQKGFSMTFGLIAVDRTTQKRCPKESLRVLGNLR